MVIYTYIVYDIPLWFWHKLFKNVYMWRTSICPILQIDVNFHKVDYMINIFLICKTVKVPHYKPNFSFFYILFFFLCNYLYCLGQVQGMCIIYRQQLENPWRRWSATTKNIYDFITSYNVSSLSDFAIICETCLEFLTRMTRFFKKYFDLIHL